MEQTEEFEGVLWHKDSIEERKNVRISGMLNPGGSRFTGTFQKPAGMGLFVQPLGWYLSIAGSEPMPIVIESIEPPTANDAIISFYGDLAR